MKRLTIALGLLSALCATASGGAYLIVIPEENTREIAALTKGYQRVKLEQMAILIDDYSQGESQLLIGKPASAEPRVGRIMRMQDWGDIPFVAVYPVSRPVSVKLEGIGRCQLLGAVATLVEASAAAGDDRFDNVVAPPDVYLLAYGMNDGWLEETRLIAVTVDDEGRRQLRVVVRTLAQRDETRGALAVTTGTLPSAVVEFPGEGEVSEDDPAWRAHVRMVFLEHVYRFALDLRIVME